MTERGWSPFDHSYTDGQMLRWQKATWRQRISMVIFFTFMWGVIFPAMAISALVVMGMMIEGIGWQNEQLDRCQRQAETPYEYHRCR